MSKIVERTLDLLELFSNEKRPLSLSDIARLLKIPKSSCHDVVRALQTRGYIYELAPRAGYYPTLRLQRLGKEIADHDPVVGRAEQLLRSLRDTLDESVLLSKVNGLHAIYLLTFEPSHPLRFLAKVGDNVRSLHATSGGKALLASLDERELKAYFKAAKLAPLTAKTITSKTTLQKDIELGRKRRWYGNHGESLEGVTTISAPFKWNTSTYIVTVAGPSQRLDPKLKNAVGLLTNVCQLLEMNPDSGKTPA